MRQNPCSFVSSVVRVALVSMLGALACTARAQAQDAASELSIPARAEPSGTPSAAADHHLAATLETDGDRTLDEGERAPELAPADVELSIGLSPGLSFGAAGTSGVGALGGLGGLGGLGSPVGTATATLVPRLEVAFALDPSIFLSLGLAGSYLDAPGLGWASLSARLGLLFYVEPPRVGSSNVHASVFAAGAGSAPVGAASSLGGQLGLSLGGALGFTWLPTRHLGLRAQATLEGSASMPLQSSGLSLALALGADCALVVRL